jgi:hypothetical protein
MNGHLLASFNDELEKIAVNLRAYHGTNQALKRIKPRSVTGKGPVLRNDPNPPMVYMAPGVAKGRHVQYFARDAANRYGGQPTLLSAKLDTKKGWRPTRLTRWGKSQGYDVDDLDDIIYQLDQRLPDGRYEIRGKARGELWEILNRASGAITNPRNPAATVKVIKSKPIK